MDPKIVAGRTRSAWVDVPCVTCDRHVHVYEGPTGPGHHYRCGYCSKRPHAARVTEFVLDMPGTIQIQMQGPQHCGPNCSQCRPPIIVPPPGAYNR